MATVRTKAARAAMQLAMNALTHAQQATQTAEAERQNLIENAENTRKSAVDRALSRPASLSQIAQITLSHRIAREDIEAAEARIETLKAEETEAFTTLKMKQSALAHCLRNEEKLGELVRTQTNLDRQMSDLVEEFEAERA
ncbi:MAG: hypothetical protein AAGA88_00935 [Pseudomonadota bacterium]